jgi:hypothetical protein
VHRTALAESVIKALAFEEQCGAVELEPSFEHLALAEQERRLNPTGILQILDWYHPASFAVFQGHLGSRLAGTRSTEATGPIVANS